MTYPIVYVHGILGSLRQPGLLHLSTSGGIAPDLLGYGAFRGADPASITLEAQVQHLDQTIASAFGNRPVHLVGHGMGGAISGLYAHAFPHRVGSLISVEGSFTPKDTFWAEGFARMSLDDAAYVLGRYREAPAKWLGRNGIASSRVFEAVAMEWFDRQPVSTLHAMAPSLVELMATLEYQTRFSRPYEDMPFTLWRASALTPSGTSQAGRASRPPASPWSPEWVT